MLVHLNRAKQDKATITSMVVQLKFEGKSEMKVSIITTVNHNVGDDFVREGITYLLKQKFTGQERAVIDCIYNKISQNLDLLVEKDFANFLSKL